MYQLTIQTGNQTWPFLFKDETKAKEARAAAAGTADVNVHAMHSVTGREFEITDDYGRTGKFSHVTGVVFEDLDQSMFANIALAIHQQHMQIKFQDMARNDPVLKARAQMAGPGIMSPFGSNGAGFGRN